MNAPAASSGRGSAYEKRPWLSAYPVGIAAEMQQRCPTALAVWDRAVAEGPDRPALHFFDQTWTYREVDRRASALAAALRAGGLRPGGRVGIFSQNDPDWPTALVATWKAGGTAVALSPMLKQRELAFQLADAGVEALVCLDELYHAVVCDVLADVMVQQVYVSHPDDWLPAGVPRAATGLIRPRRDSADGATLRAVFEDHSSLASASPSASDVAVLTYTSGTSGPPKGAMITQAGIAYNAQVFAEWLSLTPDDPILGLAPLFHVTGLVGHMALSWYAGSALILSHRFEPSVMLRSISQWRPTMSIGAITAYTALLNCPEFLACDFSSMRHVLSGGAPVTAAVVDRFRAKTGLTIQAVYGLTETTSPSHLTPPGAVAPLHAESGSLSVGVPVPGAMVEVADVETGELVEPGVAGEIVISGPMVVPGYWNRPEESARAIPGGRLFTGDIGLMAPDGWFFVIDRKKDQINASGYKVWPREVEEVLCEHPAVREAIVVGLPDPYRGETVHGVVSLLDGASVTEQELISFCRGRLAAYKYPRSIEFRAELPRTTSGKLLRRAIRSPQP